MAIILQIDTATEICSVSIAKDGEVIAVKETSEERSHASTLTVFIDELLQIIEIKKHQIDAVAVSMGPGSYTGLRIGVSAAKGLCYGYNISLISVSTLEAMSKGFQEELRKNIDDLPENVLFSPMIDARRMEVYTALFTSENKVYKDVEALISNREPLKVDLQSLLDQGKMHHNVTLKSGDVVYIPLQTALNLGESKVYVEGEVKEPGMYDYRPGLTAMNACIMAGGFDKFAAPNRTRIIREDDEEKTIIKININDVKKGEVRDIELKPGDRIHVPESWF